YRGWLLALLLLVSAGSMAQTAEDPSIVEAKKPADVRVIIDVSGSMKQNDPSNLRQPALELLVKLLPEGSKAGVWTFGKYINMLVPHKPVNDAWREDAMAKAAQINSVGLFTNIGEAIEKAGYDGDKPSAEYDTSLILLTDGMVDIDKDPEQNQKEWRRIVDEVLPELQGSGYTMHTIALSDNADTALLDKLALSTDGMSEVAKSADELLKIFLRVFDQAAPTEQVPLTENTFLVDSSIEEFTALIFRSSEEPTQLVSPDQSRYQFDKEDRDVNWYKTHRYDLITVKQPLEGEWQVLADLDPDSRVSIVSNLKLLVKPLPTNLFVDETARLSLLLQDAKQNITDPDFLGLLDIDSLVTHQDSSREWPERLSDGGPPHNGIYSTDLNMFAEEGRYNVAVVVDGKSFQRKFNHAIAVRVPFEVWLEKLVLAGQEKQLVKVRAHSQLVVHENTRVVARIKDPKGRSAIKPLQLNASDEWELLLEPEQEGVYQVRLRISGEDRDGTSFDVDPEVLRFTFPSEDNPFAQPVVSEPQSQPVIEEPQSLIDESQPLLDLSDPIPEP
ncbi:MAG: vWA domain-containing protein, partial [Pseudomonadota bacterium]|nr:vWA domain-containing protein [Pseudomonadota bacterium]